MDDDDDDDIFGDDFPDFSDEPIADADVGTLGVQPPGAAPTQPTTTATTTSTRSTTTATRAVVPALEDALDNHSGFSPSGSGVRRKEEKSFDDIFTTKPPRKEPAIIYDPFEPLDEFPDPLVGDRQPFGKSIPTFMSLQIEADGFDDDEDDDGIFQAIASLNDQDGNRVKDVDGVPETLMKFHDGSLRLAAEKTPDEEKVTTYFPVAGGEGDKLMSKCIASFLACLKRVIISEKEDPDQSCEERFQGCSGSNLIGPEIYSSNHPP